MQFTEEEEEKIIGLLKSKDWFDLGMSLLIERDYKQGLYLIDQVLYDVRLSYLSTMLDRFFDIDPFFDGFEINYYYHDLMFVFNEDFALMPAIDLKNLSSWGELQKLIEPYQMQEDA